MGNDRGYSAVIYRRDLGNEIYRGFRVNIFLYSLRSIKKYDGIDLGVILGIYSPNPSAYKSHLRVPGMGVISWRVRGT